MGKGSALEEAKQRLRDKLKDIEHQAGSLHAVIDDTTKEAEVCVQKIIEEKKKTSFFKQYPTVNQKLEEISNKLLLIKDAIYSLDEPDTDSSESETDDDDDDCGKSVVSTTTNLSDKTVTEDSHSKETKHEEKPGDLSKSTALTNKEQTDKVLPEEKPLIPNEEKSCPTDAKLKDFNEDLKAESNAAVKKDSTNKDDGVVKEVPAIPLSINVPESVPQRKASSRKTSCGSPVRTTPTMKARRRTPVNSPMSPIMPRVLSEDIVVADPIFQTNVQQTVVVTEINNPWSFYVQIMNPAYDHFMEEMCIHFSKQANQGYKGGISNLPVVGMYCCARSPIDKTWYRARITDVRTVDVNEMPEPSESLISVFEDQLLNNIQVRAFLIDEGAEIDVPVCHLRPLEQQFSYLPSQAIHCMLAGVAPLECDFTLKAFDEISWSSQSNEWFDTSIKSEGTFTGYIHTAVTNKFRHPIELYTGFPGNGKEVPDIDSSIGYMMLLVKMAKPVKIWDSHLQKYFAEIEQLFAEDEEPIAVGLDSDKKQEILDELKKSPNVRKESLDDWRKSPDITSSTVVGAQNDSDEAPWDEMLQNQIVTSKEVSKNKQGKPQDARLRQTKPKACRNEPYQVESRDVEEIPKPSNPWTRITETLAHYLKIPTCDSGLDGVENATDVGSNNSRVLPTDMQNPADAGSKTTETNIHDIGNPNDAGLSNSEAMLSDPRNLSKSTNTEEDPKHQEEIKISEEPKVIDLPAATFENRYKVKDFAVGPEGFAQVVVSNVTDPSYFFVHLMSPDVALFDQMMTELDEFYSDNDLPEPIARLDIGNAVIVRFSEDKKWYRGVIKHFKVPDKGIARRSITDDEFVYNVLHVDFGSSEWVGPSEIRPVVETFFELPIETLPCCLAGISPMETSRDIGCRSSTSSPDSELRKSPQPTVTPNTKKSRKSSSIFDDEIERPAGDEIFNNVFDSASPDLPQASRVKWSSSATKRLVELTLDGERRFASLKKGCKNSRLPDEPWQVYLYDTNGDTEIFINNLLVDESLAVSDVYTKATDRVEYPEKQAETKKVIIKEEELREMIAQGSMEDRLKEPPTTPPSSELPGTPTSPTTNMLNEWNPMKEDFLSQRNAYTVDTDDPGLATTGFADPKRNICRNFLSRRGCFRGKSCPREHSRPDDISNIKQEAFCVTDQNMVLPKIGDFVLIQVTNMMTPVHFYIRFPFGTKSLKELLGVGHFTDQFDDTDELFELQESMNKRYSKMVFRNSDLVPFCDGELITAKFEEDGQWYRSRVIAELDKKYKVFFIDYGNTAIVKESDTRRLLPGFLYLENQAVEAYLANVGLKASVQGEEILMEDAMKCFQDCCSGDNNLIARIMSKAVNGELYLELYDKQTNTNINKLLLTKPYFQETSCLKQPWDMSKAMSVSPSTSYLIPG